MSHLLPLAFALRTRERPDRPGVVLGYGMLLPDGTAVTAESHAGQTRALAYWPSAQAAADGFAAELVWGQVPVVAGPARAAVPASHPVNRRPDHDRVWRTGRPV